MTVGRALASITGVTEPGPPPNQHARVGGVLAGRYRLERLLGGDGLAAVFASRSPDDGRPVTACVLDDALHDDADVVRVFLEEARRCQRLVHPNLARVLDAGTAERGVPFAIVERHEGVLLSEYTGSNVRVPLAQASAILQGILAGLGAAHAHGAVHRELTPASVALAREPAGDVTPKIHDLGIGAVLAAARSGGRALHATVKLRTKAYGSPEQIGAAHGVDARTDLWSAGVIFYEMITGRPAFAAPTEFALVMAILKERPLPVERIEPSLARVSAFLARALDKDPGARFSSALEMARALAASMGDDAKGVMSRLPAVASVLLPSARAAGDGDAPTAPAGAPDAARPVASSPPTQAPGRAAPSFATAPPLAERAPRVEVGGTLPSEGLPILPAPPARSIGAAVAVVLVAVALAVGFGLGFAAAIFLR